MVLVKIIERPEIERIIKQVVNVKPLWDETSYLRKKIVSLEEEIKLIKEKNK